MESAGVSKMPARLMELIFRGDLFSRKAMDRSRWTLLVITVILSACGPVATGTLTGVEFEQSPAIVISSLGKSVKLDCTLKATGSEEDDPPDVLWLRDAVPLQYADTNQFQVLTGSNSWTIMSTLSIEKVELSDMGHYQCAVLSGSHQILSKEGSIQLEGLPHFSVEPHHMSVVANVSLSLSCVAHGPPEPVSVIWLQDGVPLNKLTDPVALSPSTLNLTGLNRTSTFSCEAHNRKGVATSGSGTITVLPSQPHNLRAVEITQTSFHLSWQPGFGGDYPIMRCSVQVRPPEINLRGKYHNWLKNHSSSNHFIRDLEPHSLYAVRVACHSSQGPSDWSPWVELRTKEGGNLHCYLGLAVLINILYNVAVFLSSESIIKGLCAENTIKMCFFSCSVNSLGISDELKQKLQDVMVDRHKLTLGKTLGEGEFGSVMEGLLTHEESVLKVAVKTMKIAICTRSEMEDFLREAACMKEFDHPNVMRLLGVCLQTVESEGYPSPVVILPYMKHGDLHSYLLYSRLGDCPYLPSQMLVKFMTDIARGMEYLSNKNFIHRDLAARNCMLNENMNVCVADFGLSKKIYNGDYYRQGRISKMPVKWIAIESLADRVYTTKSDVWSFGVTMWEIATRGQTPYPGVENSEIYDYLRQGNRLKQPPDCLDSIYSLMFSCWLLSPKDRPSFESLRCELEKALEDLPDTQDPDEILYVNMDESSMELGAVGGRDPTGGAPPLCLKGLDSVTTVEVHHPNRYVLCPQHETNRALSDSLESLDMPVSSSTATLPLQTKGLFFKLLS
uniref:receptor protein-tyrosine kinase n=1 Tax=Anabas testudineus TaxID=64144 RepID=A0A7N6B0S5_ANATE